MDGRLIFGLGASLVSLFIRWLFPTAPRPLAWAGLSAGVGLVGLSWMPWVSSGPAILGLCGLTALTGAVAWQFSLPRIEVQAVAPHQQPSDGERRPAQRAETDESAGHSKPDLASHTRGDEPEAVRATTVSASALNPSVNPARDADNVDRGTVDALAAFVAEGEEIKGRFMASDDAGAVKAEQAEWATKVQSYLATHVGKAQAVQFQITDANPMDGQPAGRSDAGGYHWAKIVARNRLLAHYMRELQRSVIDQRVTSFGQSGGITARNVGGEDAKQ